MLKSDSIKEISAALAKAQALFPEIPKDKVVKVKLKSGGEYTYKYAELSSIVNATRKPLADNGLSFSQTIGENEKGMTCETMLMHSSGEWILGITPMILKETDMQGMGGALTFSRRYGLSALIGVATEEDTDGDGSNRGASKPEQKPYQQPAKTTPPPPANKTAAPPPPPKPTSPPPDPEKKNTSSLHPNAMNHAPASADTESIADYVDRPLSAMEKVELSKWVMPGGNFKGKKLGEVDQHALLGYRQELLDLESQGKRLLSGHIELIKKIEQFYSDVI